MVLLDLQVLAKPSTAAMQDDWIYKVQELLREHGYEVREGLGEPQLPAVFYPPTPLGAHIALVASDEARERGCAGRRAHRQAPPIHGDQGEGELPEEGGPRHRGSVQGAGVGEEVQVWVEGEQLEEVRREVAGLAVPR